MNENSRKYVAQYTQALKFSNGRTHNDFTDKIADNPDELTGSLVFADWLDEQGSHGSAEVIRKHTGDNGVGPINFLSGDGSHNRLMRRNIAGVGAPESYSGPFAAVDWKYGTNPNGPGKEPTKIALLRLFYPHSGGHLLWMHHGPVEHIKNLLSQMPDVLTPLQPEE